MNEKTDKKEEPKEKTYTRIQTREEIEDEMIDLQEHPNFKMFIQWLDGKKKVDKYNKLAVSFEGEEDKKKE